MSSAHLLRDLGGCFNVSRRAVRRPLLEQYLEDGIDIGNDGAEGAYRKRVGRVEVRPDGYGHRGWSLGHGRGEGAGAQVEYVGTVTLSPSNLSSLLEMRMSPSTEDPGCLHGRRQSVNAFMKCVRPEPR